jgi:hypothetical protein
MIINKRVRRSVGFGFMSLLAALIGSSSVVHAQSLSGTDLTLTSPYWPWLWLRSNTGGSLRFDVGEGYGGGYGRILLQGTTKKRISFQNGDAYDPAKWFNFDIQTGNMGLGVVYPDAKLDLDFASRDYIRAGIDRFRVANNVVAPK